MFLGVEVGSKYMRQLQERASIPNCSESLGGPLGVQVEGVSVQRKRESAQKGGLFESWLPPKPQEGRAFFLAFLRYTALSSLP